MQPFWVQFLEFWRPCWGLIFWLMVSPWSKPICQAKSFEVKFFPIESPPPQIEQMEDELNAVSRTQKDLELQVKDAKGRMVVAVSDLSTEKKKHVKQQGLHNRLQRDLADVQNQLQARLPDGKI